MVIVVVRVVEDRTDVGRESETYGTVSRVRASARRVGDRRAEGWPDRPIGSGLVGPDPRARVPDAGSWERGNG